MGLASETVRYILFFFNFLLALIGLVVFVMAVAVSRADDDPLNDKPEEYVHSAAVKVAVVAAFIFIMAFLGCWGALRENHKMISVYIVMILVLFTIQLGLVVIVFFGTSLAEEVAVEFVDETFSNYTTDANVTKQIDNIQQKLECCGTYNNTTPWTSLNMPPPASCYPHKNSTDKIFPKGCIPIMLLVVDMLFRPLRIITVLVAVVEFAGAVFSLYLARGIRKGEFRSIN